MDLINNRYRVIRNIKQSRLVSSYIVNDMMDGHKLLQLNILNSEYLPEGLLNFYTKEFIRLSSIDSSSLIKNYDFNIINLIDNKRLDNNQYFFTNEYFENNCHMFDLSYSLDENKILELFTGICCTVNYLHLRGFLYGDLNINNILASKDNEENYSYFLKDLATLELEKYDYWTAKDDDLVFKAPEVLAGGDTTIAADIYSLGILLFALIKKNISRQLNLQQELEKLKSNNVPVNGTTNYSRTFLDKIIPLIAKMTDQNPAQRYKFIRELINDINSSFQKDYKTHRQEELEKLNFNIKLIGRDYEVNNILGLYDSMIKYELDKKLILVHGEYGIGKTKFLKEIERLFILKGASVYSSYAMEDINSNGDKVCTEILKKLISESDAETLERYEVELVKVIPEIGDRKKIKSFEALSGEKEKVRILNGVFGFISDVIKGKPAVFIVDNLHLANEFSIELFEYMYIRNKNIMFLFTYCDGEVAYNKRFAEFVQKVTGKSNFVDVSLHGLNNDETAIMVQNILGMSAAPTAFAVRIYSKTYGSPIFIQETLKNLFSKGAIHLEKKTGVWFADCDDGFEKLPIPSNMQQAVLNQIKHIDGESYEILMALSIFNTGVPIDMISGLLYIEEEKLIPMVEDLEEKGVLCRKIEDRGFVFDFSNRVLKNLIRSKLQEEYKKSKHEIASALLEKQYDEGRENKDELIYHLEMAGEKEKVIKYCLENAEKMALYKNRNEVIKNLIKAISMYGEENIDDHKIELLIKVGDVYWDDRDGTNAIKYYDKAERVSSKSHMYRYQIDALNRIAQVYFRKNEIENASKFLKKSEKILNKPDFVGSYTVGYLECKQIQASILFLKQEYENAKALCLECIDLCGSENNKLKGLFYKTLGNTFIDNGNPNEALKGYQASLKYCEEANYHEGIAMALNNLAVVYGDFYQDNKKAIGYLNQMKELSEKNNLISYEIMALTNLASSYIYDWNYELALENFLHGLSKSKKIDFETNIFYCYHSIAESYIKLSNYEEAYKFFTFAQEELEKYPEHGKEVVSHYQTSALIFYEIGDYERAEEFIKKTTELHKAEEYIQKWDCEIQFQHIDICKSSCEEMIHLSIEKIRETSKKYLNGIYRINILYDLCIVLYQKGLIEEASELFDESKEIECSFIPDRIESKELYLKAVLGNSHNKYKTLNMALDIVKKEKDKKLHWKICTAIGDYYFTNRNYFYAINYYFEACEVIKDIELQLPEELRIKFIKTPGVLKPFNRLISMNKNGDYAKSDEINEEFFNITSSDELERLLSFEYFKDILTNRHFIKSAKKIYTSYLPKSIRDIKDIAINLYQDPVRNLELIAKYLASVTLATRSLILVDTYEQKYYTIASSDGTNYVPSNKYIFEKVRALKEPILVTENSVDKYSAETSFLPAGVKGVICIPIVLKEEGLPYKKDDKRKNLFGATQVKGYIYMESERALNNFNSESLLKSMEAVSLAGFMIEKYQLQRSSSIDKLTGVYTRKFLEDSLNYHIDRADEIGSNFSIIMMDMDNFKNINDRFGHQAGDEVLTKTCSILSKSIRKDDIIGRYGGEEFIIILPDTDSKGAIIAAEKLRKEIEVAKILGDKTSVTVSMGAATYPKHAQWKQELIEKADQALYVSKELGRNRCQLWNSEFSNKVKVTNKLSGIISGNPVQDSRNVLVMVELIELIKQDSSKKEKIYNLLGRIIESTESEYGMLFIMENGEITEKYGRKIFEEKWIDVKAYNLEILNSVAEKKQGIYMTDWDETSSYDIITGAPDWHSIVVVPLVNSGIVKGILYLTVSTKEKEFKFNEFNFINTLGELVAAML